jgi:NOL1/NOP2/fmu family ribosome biogenesis protein
MGISKCSGDVILVDAPCSGEGLFRKDKNAIKEWSMKNVSLCTTRQKQILDDIIVALKPGGILIYSTCTYNYHENEEQIVRLINQYQFEPLFLKTHDEWGIKINKDFNLGYRFYPHLTHGEGFFISALKKPGTVSRTEKYETYKLNIVSDTERKQLDETIVKSSDYNWISLKEKFYLFPEIKVKDLQCLYKNMNITYFGIEALTQKNQLLPLHPLAMSTVFNSDYYEKIDLSLTDAIKYLKKENDFLNGNKGWNTIIYKGIPLGLVKQTDNRTNNYYPSEWRIRKK